jgi:hypothetical protein
MRIVLLGKGCAGAPPAKNMTPHDVAATAKRKKLISPPKSVASAFSF